MRASSKWGKRAARGIDTVEVRFIGSKDDQGWKEIVLLMTKCNGNKESEAV